MNTLEKAQSPAWKALASGQMTHLLLLFFTVDVFEE